MVRKEILAMMTPYELGIMLLGSVKDTATYNAILTHIRGRGETNVAGGVFGGPDAAKELPHDTVVELIAKYKLDASAYVNPTVCTCCGTTVGVDVKLPADKTGKRKASLAICHIVPRSRGGATNAKNLFVGCAVCNQQASNKVDDDMIAALAK